MLCAAQTRESRAHEEITGEPWEEVSTRGWVGVEANEETGNRLLQAFRVGAQDGGIWVGRNRRKLAGWWPEHLVLVVKTRMDVATANVRLGND